MSSAPQVVGELPVLQREADEAALTQRALALGRRVEDVAPDGNCFFHAVALFLAEEYGDATKDHAQLRAEAVDWAEGYLMDNPEAHWLTATTEDGDVVVDEDQVHGWTHRMRQNGVSAEDWALPGLAHSQNLRLCVVNPRQPEPNAFGADGAREVWIGLWPDIQWNGALVYEGHYQALLSGGDGSPPLSAAGRR